MTCSRCASSRLLEVVAKCSDLCEVSIGNNKSSGYVPEDLNIGGGDYIEFTVCLDCGQLQGKFPVDKCDTEEYLNNLDEFFTSHFNEGELFSDINPSRRSMILCDAEELDLKLSKFIRKLFDKYCKSTDCRMPSANELQYMFDHNKYNW